MNLALLSKLGWHLTIASGRMWTQALKAKYFNGISFLRCEKKMHVS